MKDGDTYATRHASTAAGLQEAIDALAGGKGKVFIGPGTLELTAAFYLTSNMMLEGCGSATVLKRGSGMLGTVLIWDNGSALSNVVLRDITFDNDSLAVTTRDINLVGACQNVIIEGCIWQNLTNRVGDLARISTSSTASKNIKIRNNTVVGPGSEQTYNSFQVFDSSDVDVTGNYIEGWGAIKVEGSSAADLYNWNISRNRFKSVDQTNIFTRVQNASSVSGVVVADNNATDCGKAFLACDAVNASDTGLMRDITISNNAVRGFGVSLLDDAIQVGGVVTSGTFYCTNVTVVGNSLNGLKSDGTFPSTTERGISVEAGTQYVSVYANSVRNCGRSGIGIGASDCVVSGNVVERCVRRDTTASAPTPTQEGGIATFGNSVYSCKNVLITGNICKNNGVDGTTTSNGITVSRNNTGTSEKHDVVGNRCYDDQGTQTQAYGIAIGSAAGVSADGSIISGNDVRGNATAGLLFQGSATGLSYLDNIDSTATTIASAATISIPLNGDDFHVTGTTNITNGVTVNAWDNGRIVTLIFDDILTMSDTGTSVLSAAYVTTANDTLTLRCDGTNWYEVSRSAN